MANGPSGGIVPGSEWIFYVPALESVANTPDGQANPTIATGDAKLSYDGGAFANLTTLPTVTPAGGTQVKVTVTAAESTSWEVGKWVTVHLVDAADDEWKPLYLVAKTEEAVPAANVAQISGDATAADNAEAFFDGTGYAGTNNVIPTVTEVSQLGTQAKADVNAEADQALTDYGAVVPADLPTNFADLAITVTTGLVDVNDKTGYALSAQGIQDIWDALTSALTTVGSIGKLLVDNIDTALSGLSSHSAADVWAAGTRTLTAGTKDTEIDAIKAKTDNLPADPADDSDIDTQLAAIAAYIDTEVAAIKAKTDNLPAAPAATGDIPTAGSVADAVWDEAKAGHVAAGSFGEEVQAHALSSEISDLNDITVAEVLAGVIEGTYTVKQSMRLLLAALAGKSTGGGTASVAFRDTGDSKDRIQATVDADGNRSAVTLDVTD